MKVELSIIIAQPPAMPDFLVYFFKQSYWIYDVLLYCSGRYEATNLSVSTRNKGNIDKDLQGSSLGSK